MSLGRRPPSEAGTLVVVITDVLRVEGLGMVVIGDLRSGVLSVGDDVVVTRPDGQTIQCRVRGIQLHRTPGLDPRSIDFLLDAEADDFLEVGSVVRQGHL